MANSRTPGPTGSDRASSELDDGTLVRVRSPRPGVIGLDDAASSAVPVSARATPGASASGQSAEDRVIQSVQHGAGFSVAGNRFRLIRAAQWPRFQHDFRFMLLSQPEARRVLEELAAASTSPADADVLQDAMSLLADTSLRLAETGLLLLRITETAGGGGTAAPGEQPVTRSQLSRRSGTGLDAPRPIPERPSIPPAPPVPPAPPPLSFYEVVVLDELESPIAGVEVELTTPAGTQTLVTDGSGLVRVDDVPPGTGSAHIVSAQQLVDVLRDRVEVEPRRTPLPQDEMLLVVTPRRVDTSVSFPDATTQRIMVVNRTDMVWGSVVEHWGDLMLLSEENGPSRLAADELTATLKLSSTGAGPSALIGLPPSGVLLRDHANLDITGEAITDRLDQNARLTIDIDALHEALFAADFDAVAGLIGVAAEQPPPAPDPPPFPFPSEEGIDFAAELALLALQGIFDSPILPERQL